MLNLIISVSRYLFIVLMLCYVFLNFYYYSKKTNKGKRRVVHCQACIIFIYLLLSSIILNFNKLDIKAFFLCIVMFIFFLGYLIIYPKVYPYANQQMITNAVFLLAIGMMLLARLNVNKAWNQMILIVIAAVISFLVPYILSNGKKYLYKGTWIYGIAGIAALLAVLVGGKVEYGANLGISIGGISIQASEFVKITLVFFAAGMFQVSHSFKRIVVTTVVAASHVLILVMSKDLGSALIFVIAYIFMLYIATENIGWVFAGFGATALASIAAYYMFSHVRTRVAIWQDPWADMNGDGWQIIQSWFGIGTGGWFGMGYTNGMPYLTPVGNKDFIFSVLCEEMGVIFAIGVLLVSLGLLLQFLWISTWMKQTFLKIMAFGIASVYGIQILINVAGVIKLIPLTGITYPLLSYGGSSLLSTFIMLGIMEGLSILKIKEDEEDEREKAEQAARLEAARKAKEKAANEWKNW
jgi:cell division protein FtsW (lipid II flippase)